MALKIMTTGLQQYSAGGTGRVKVLVIGGPGVGKTRWSSYFPKPFYLDCEGGLASIADRNVPFVTIKSSQDMLEALTFLRQESMRPEQDRTYRTVVVDTLDAFQRKVKDEWLLAHPNEQSFRGYEAWGYLDTKMQMLLTRLLNLDMNVIVAVHYTDKTITEGTGNDAVQRQEIQLQLSGAIKDQVFNDFDLVGWMGVYYEAVGGERVQKRGLTFVSTFEKPFLKDRLHVTPPWMEVTFDDQDYADLFAAVTSKLDALVDSEEVGEVPSLAGDGTPPPGVVGPLTGGALSPVDPKELPLAQYDKPALQKLARELGVDFKGNTLKSELITSIEARQKELAEAPAPVPAEETPTPVSTDVQPAPEATPASVPAVAVAPVAPEPEANPASAAPHPEQAARDEVFNRLQAQREASEAAARAAVVATEAPAVSTPAEPAPAAPAPAAQPEFVVDQGRTINTATGEIVSVSEDEAVANVENGLGGEVVLVTQDVEAPVVAPPAVATPAPVQQAAATGKPTHCQEDGCTNAVGPNPDYVKLSFIKYRKYLCDEHYLARKKAS